MVEFKEWPKIPRLFKDVIITEKIDGTNGCIIVTPEGEVHAQSRKRLLKAPHDDNFGFAAWVAENAESLKADLGEGYHYGEWWGKGIQRGYGQDGRRFSLFNVSRWSLMDLKTPDLRVVPTLYTSGEFSTQIVKMCLEILKQEGSQAAPGFMEPEGVVVFHVAANKLFKATYE